MIKFLLVILFFFAQILSAQPTLINFILDESGSMETIKQATIDGFNEYASTMRKKDNVFFVFTRFNGCKKKTIEYAKPLIDYAPNCNTPLYDALGYNLRYASDRVKDLTEKCKHCKQDIIPKVLCIILTDGLENASKEYSRSDISENIKAKKEQGWEFVYLGANQDAFEVAKTISIDNGLLWTSDDKCVPTLFKAIGNCSSDFDATGELDLKCFDGINEVK